MWRRYLLISLFVFLGILSISLKVTGNSNIEDSHKHKIELLTQYMSTRGLTPAETFDLNNEGSFTAHVYRHKTCDGGWLISPMYRNSEAVSLFTRQAIYRDYMMGSVFYLLGDETYKTFPDLNLWLSQKINAVKHIAGLSDNGMNPVFAIRRFGYCKKEDRL